MRKLIAIVVALSVGVGAGLGSSELWVRARVLPYCKVATNAEAYHMKFIRVKAKVYFTSSGTYIYEHCDPVESLMSSIYLEGSDRSTFGLGYVNESLATDPYQTKTAEAIVEGEFNAEASPGCWTPKFSINARQIELVSPMEVFVPED
jgi:hypothetical protein